jgi:hypothetical protein
VELTGAVSSAVTNSAVTGGIYVISASEGHDNQTTGNALNGRHDLSGQQVGPTMGFCSSMSPS